MITLRSKFSWSFNHRYVDRSLTFRTTFIFKIFVTPFLQKFLLLWTKIWQMTILFIVSWPNKFKIVDCKLKTRILRSSWILIKYFSKVLKYFHYPNSKMDQVSQQIYRHFRYRYELPISPAFEQSRLWYLWILQDFAQLHGIIETSAVFSGLKLWVTSGKRDRSDYWIIHRFAKLNSAHVRLPTVGKFFRQIFIGIYSMLLPFDEIVRLLARSDLLPTTITDRSWV